MKLEIIKSEHLGYCVGVKNAIDAALKNAKDAVVLGDMVNNAAALDELKKARVRTVASVEEVDAKKCIIRSHGAPPEVYESLRERGIEIIDATCSFVKKIHGIVAEHYNKGHSIIICGKAGHPEVVGINGCCGYSAQIISRFEEIDFSKLADKVCVVAQTTFLHDKFREITANIEAENTGKTVEIFDTICYTTEVRQKEARKLSGLCDVILVVGSKISSNTDKLLTICKEQTTAYLIESANDLKKIKLEENQTVGIISGASAPKGLTQEVINFMSEKEGSFEQLLGEEKHVYYRAGSRVKATVVSADEKGVIVKIGGKNDGFIKPEEAVAEGAYDPQNFAVGAEFFVIIKGLKESDTGCIPVSKKDVDEDGDDKIVEEIRDGQEFSLTVKRVIEKGLLAKLGSYRVFIPQSQVSINFIRDLKPFEGKKLRLSVLSIDDEKKNIVASQKKVLEGEKKVVEDAFFDAHAVNDIVTGKVMRITPFGAFVDVKGFDCLAHISDLSWNKAAKAEDVLTIGNEYDFVVLKIEREKSRVSLGYKQLTTHPFEDAISKYPLGSTVSGKVVRLSPFGAFVEIEKGLDGLVHISEASHDYVKNIADVLKAGDEISAVITKIDIENHKVSLSIKAATPAPEAVEFNDNDFETADKPARSDRREKFEKRAEGAESGEKSDKPRAPRKDRAPADAGPKEWSEDAKNNPFADLLKEYKE
jgi:4-hydroxy-3-methylbut-2-enyl diphosphate reductase